MLVDVEQVMSGEAHQQALAELKEACAPHAAGGFSAKRPLAPAAQSTLMSVDTNTARTFFPG